MSTVGANNSFEEKLEFVKFWDHLVNVEQRQQSATSGDACLQPAASTSNFFSRTIGHKDEADGDPPQILAQRVGERTASDVPLQQAADASRLEPKK